MNRTSYFNQVFNYIKFKRIDFLESRIQKSKLKLSNLKKSNVIVKDESSYFTLTPVDLRNEENSDTYYTYSKVLKEKIDNENVKNIAITGLYGSGKSSVINTFINEYKEDYKFLNISLSNFSNENKENITEEIEKSIVQQILYQVEESKIPDSRFKRIKTFKKHILFFKYVHFLIFVGSYYLFFNSHIYSVLGFNKLKYYDLIKFQSVVFIILFIFSIPYFNHVYKFLLRISVEKLNLKNGEIGFKSDNGNTFNKHLDEIIYFFEITKNEVVVFEDLDRFNNIKIYEELRELNTLLNNYFGIKKSIRKITFIYAVRDDLFTSKKHTDRVKFFDFILPIISVINSSNSFQFIKRLFIKRPNGIPIPDDIFLRSISIYLNDLRLLKNIYNEYITYYQLTTRIEDEIMVNHDPIKVFSIVTYKSFYPNDFNNLMQSKGLLYEIFSENYNKELIKDEIDDLVERKNKFELDLKELKNKEFKEEDFDEDELIQYSSEKNYYSTELNKINYAIETILNKNVSEKISRHNQSNFVKITSKFFTNKHKELDEEKNQFINDPFVFVALKNGFIDKNYQLYLSHYYEGGMTLNDIEFISYVNENTKIDNSVDLNLNFIDEVIERIYSSKFVDNSVVNIDLLNFLFENKSKYESKIKSIVRNFKVIDEFKFKLVIKSLEIEEYFNVILNLIYENLELLVDFIDYDSKNQTYLDIKHRYLLKTLSRINFHQLSYFKQYNKRMNKYLINNPYFFDNEFIDLDSIVNIFKLLDLKINILNSEKTERFYYFLKNHFFIPNKRNFNYILNICSSYEINLDSSNFLKNVFESISEDADSYIREYFIEFINEVFSGITKLQNEIEEDLIVYFELSYDSIEVQSIILEKNTTKIKNVSKLENDDFKKLIFKKLKADLNWENFLLLYSYEIEEGFIEENVVSVSDSLIEFINNSSNFEEFTFDEIENEDLTNEDFEKLKINILLNNDLSIIAFKELISTSSKELTTKIDFIEITNEEKIELLIALKHIECNPQNYNSINENFEFQIALRLLESNIEIVTNHFSSYDLDTFEINELLSSDLIEKKDKLFLIKNHTFYFSNSIKFKEKNFKFLVENFEVLNSFNLNEKINFLDNLENENMDLKNKFIIKLIEIHNSKSDLYKIFNRNRNLIELFNSDKGPVIIKNVNGVEVILNTLKDLNRIGTKVTNKNGDFRVYRVKF